ncbi:F390 synthetase-related protein [Hyphomonas sp.]|uniref:F390 synthetase-related protein n=1 Tax=Hyphomonas sp. TaxID=87 RepID=UPI00391D1450
MKAAALTLYAFWRAQARARRLSSAEAVRDLQARRLRHFLDNVAPRAAAFTGMKGRPLTEFPVMDKSVLMSGFHRYNAPGITSDQAWAAFETTGRIGRHSVGASTGTSGNRGLYVISEAERYLWLGTLLAKALPDAIRRAYRVAVMLPTSSRLYEAANETGRLALKFFDLKDGLDTLIPAVAKFAPDVIVAPPHALLALARADAALRPDAIFSGAEVLEMHDRKEIEARFGLTVREIYMATEGLFGVACAHGTLHLCEDCVAFEWEDEGGLSKPLITDFTRRTQMMVRYRMNDLLQLSAAPCTCGSPLQAVSAIAGRLDDCFVLPGLSGQPITITPDILRNAIVSADRRISDFRLVQEGETALRLALPPGFADLLPAAEASVQTLLNRLGAKASITAATERLTLLPGSKLRRIHRAWSPTR